MRFQGKHGASGWPRPGWKTFPPPRSFRAVDEALTVWVVSVEPMEIFLLSIRYTVIPRASQVSTTSPFPLAAVRFRGESSAGRWSGPPLSWMVIVQHPTAHMVRTHARSLSSGQLIVVEIRNWRLVKLPSSAGISPLNLFLWSHRSGAGQVPQAGIFPLKLFLWRYRYWRSSLPAQRVSGSSRLVKLPLHRDFLAQSVLEISPGGGQVPQLCRDFPAQR